MKLFLLLLSKEKYWDTWHRSTLATARAQCGAEVLKPNYRRVINDDVNLFKE